MKFFMQSTKNARTIYTSYTGMTRETVDTLMAELGHTDIIEMTEEDYNQALAALLED